MVFKGSTPDVTSGQIGALVTFIVGQAVAYGWITDSTAQIAVSVGATVIAAVWKLSDAYLRGSRAKAVLTPPTNSRSAKTKTSA